MERQTAKLRDLIVDRLLFERHITPEEAEVLRRPHQEDLAHVRLVPWSELLESPAFQDMLPARVAPCLFEEAAKRGETGPLCLSCPCPRCTPTCVYRPPEV